MRLFLVFPCSGRSLFGVFRFDKGFEAGEARLPKCPVLVEPGVDGAKRPGIELVDPVAALAALLDEASSSQQAKMFGNSRTGNREGPSNATSGEAAAAEQIEDGAARGVGEGAEDGLCRMCNRTVTHNA
jgi:hypothetical protein